MDWGLVTFTRERKVYARQRMFFPWPIYVFISIINLLLRFSWSINRLPGMQNVHSSVIVLILELGEIFRRAMWNIFRIEWEIIVQQDRASMKGESSKVAGAASLGVNVVGNAPFVQLSSLSS